MPIGTRLAEIIRPDSQTPFNPPSPDQPEARLKYFEKGYGPTAAYISARDAGEVETYLAMEHNSDFRGLNLPAIYDEVLELRKKMTQQRLDNTALDQLVEDSKNN